MTTKQAYEKMRQMFPGRKIEVWHWFESNPCVGKEETFMVKIDDQNFCGQPTFEQCIEMARIGSETTQQRVDRIRDRARQLLQEAVDIERADRKAEVTEDAAVLKQDMIEDPHCYVLEGGAK